MTLKTLKKKQFHIEPDRAGYALHGDGKPFMTPAGHPFVVPTSVLATAILNEWQSQKDKIDPSTMPMTQLAATALDIVSKDCTAVVDAVCLYATAELLCHRVETPPELAARQHATWQPLLDWCAGEYGGQLNTTTGIMPIAQPEGSLSSLRRIVTDLDVFTLAGLRQAVEVSGSLVLGLALLRRKLAPEQVLRAAELDADFQAEAWGDDPAAEAKRAKNLADLTHCAAWFAGLVH